MDKEKSALVIFADGFEELEAVGTADMLRRLGLKVTTAALNWKRAVGAHGEVQAGDGQGAGHHAFSMRSKTPSAT